MFRTGHNAGSRLERGIRDLYPRIRDDIFEFAKLMNFEPTPQQAVVMGMVQRGDKRIAVRSGQGAGKTSLVSGIVAPWRVLQAPKSVCVVTAPTMRQCKEIFLRGAREMVEGSDALIQQIIEVTRSRMIVCGDADWGVVTATATTPEGIAGWHGDNLTFIVEEASGVARDIIETIEGTLSQATGDMLFLQIGNPTTRDSAFFDCFFGADAPKWSKYRMNTEESPIVSKEHVAHLKHKYGEDSDFYRIRVKGEFPEVDPNCVMSDEPLIRAGQRDPVELVPEIQRGMEKPARQIGLDFARFGSDESTVYRRSGNAIVEWQTFHHMEPADVVRAAFRMQERAGWEDEETWYIADAGGMGQGVMFMFYEAHKNVYEFHSNGRAGDGKLYDNQITEAYFEFADLAKEDKVAIPDDLKLRQQLSNRQYYHTRKGRLIIESKKDFAKRGHDSPDRADGLVLAFYDRTQAQSQVTDPRKKKGKPDPEDLSTKARIFRQRRRVG